jgi:hypothetical protein
MQYVVHCRKSPYDIYIGRPSLWGNPFIIGQDGNRQEVIEKYKLWLPAQPHIISRIHELRGKILGCWCYPLPCHGHILATLANSC